MGKNLQAICVQLKALSKKVDKIVTGFGGPKKSKPKSTAKKSTRKRAPKIAVGPKISTNQKAPDTKIDINVVSENGIEDSTL